MRGAEKRREEMPESRRRDYSKEKRAEEDSQYGRNEAADAQKEWADYYYSSIIWINFHM